MKGKGNFFILATRRERIENHEITWKAKSHSRFPGNIKSIFYVLQANFSKIRVNKITLQTGELSVSKH
jgi:hypothetical protein